MSSVSTDCRCLFQIQKPSCLWEFYIHHRINKKFSGKDVVISFFYFYFLAVEYPAHFPVEYRTYVVSTYSCLCRTCCDRLVVSYRGQQYILLVSRQEIWILMLFRNLAALQMKLVLGITEGFYYSDGNILMTPYCEKGSLLVSAYRLCGLFFVINDYCLYACRKGSEQ